MKQNFNMAKNHLKHAKFLQLSFETLQKPSKNVKKALELIFPTSLLAHKKTKKFEPKNAES